MYTLRKISIEEGKDSRVYPGYTVTGPDITLFKYDEPDEKIEVESLDDIEEGWQIFLYRGLTTWLRTSKISEIVSREPGKVVFKTQTSLYELKEESDD